VTPPQLLALHPGALRTVVEHGPRCLRDVQFLHRLPLALASLSQVRDRQRIGAFETQILEDPDELPERALFAAHLSGFDLSDLPIIPPLPSDGDFQMWRVYKGSCT
jgi:hypothetical protein